MKLQRHHTCCLGDLIPPNLGAKQTPRADTSDLGSQRTVLSGRNGETRPHTVLPPDPRASPSPRLTSSQETTVGPSHWAKGIPFRRASSSSWCLGGGTTGSLVFCSLNQAESWGPLQAGPRAAVSLFPRSPPLNSSALCLKQYETSKWVRKHPACPQCPHTSHTLT